MEREINKPIDGKINKPKTVCADYNFLYVEG